MHERIVVLREEVAADQLCADGHLVSDLPWTPGCEKGGSDGLPVVGLAFVVMSGLSLLALAIRAAAHTRRLRNRKLQVQWLLVLQNQRLSQN